MIFRVKIKNFIVIILIAIGILYRINGVLVPWYFKYICTAPIIVYGGFLYLKNQKSKESRIAKSVFNYAMIPIWGSLLYTIILLLFGVSEMQFFSRSISVFLQMLLTFLFVLAMTVIFKKEAIFVIFKAMVLSYMFTIILALKGIGIKGIKSYIINPLSSEYNTWFEMHDICIAVGIGILYFLFCDIGEHSKWKNVTVGIIVLFLGFKRIALFAILAATFFGFWINKKENVISETVLKVSSIIAIIVSAVYTYICTTDIYQSIALKYGINTASRVRIYANFRRYYDLSLSYLGKGMGYVNKQLTILQRNRSFGVGVVTALHNDFLCQYVELGFIGSFIIFLYYIIGLPRMLKNKFGYKIYRFYYILLVYALITYTSDNTLHYFLFQSLLYLSLASEIITGYDVGDLESKSIKQINS